MDFGFTNDLSKLEADIAFRDAAISDGWVAKPTYGNHEPMESHATLKKEGFVMHAKCRKKPEGERWKAETGITIWGPDGLQIDVPTEYDWNEIGCFELLAVWGNWRDNLSCWIRWA